MQVQTTQKYKTFTSSNLESLRVLIVDDELMIRDTLKQFLQNLGVTFIQTVEDGSKALMELERNRYDFVFMDLMMPKMGGMEALKRISKSDDPICVILMTGHPSMDIVIEAMHYGASDFLIKPFRFQDIKLVLDRILRLHILMEKNWLLHQEVEGKKEIITLNNQLQKKIRLQTLMFNIVDSLSHLNQSEDLYQYLVEKSIESCDAACACFMIYDGKNSDLIILAHKGFESLAPGTRTILKNNSKSQELLDRGFIKDIFGESINMDIQLDRVNRINDFISLPLNIRNEPFGLLVVSGKNSEKSFDKEDEFILRFLAEKATLNIENIALYDNLKQSLMASLMSLVSAIEAKDKYTQQHSSRVTGYAVHLAEKLKCSPSEIQKLDTSGPLHDIGKIGVSDNILNKPGRLTDEEFDYFKTHPLIGENIVMPLGLDSEELSIIRNHHERWDGKGYPDGLKGDDIPKLSRILAVADSFDAMNSNRAYRKALPFSTCIEELKKNRGSQFDPDVVDAALSVFLEIS